MDDDDDCNKGNGMARACDESGDKGWREMHAWARHVMASCDLSPKAFCDSVGLPYSGSVDFLLAKEGKHYPPGGAFGERVRNAIAMARQAHDDDGDHPFAKADQNASAEDRFAEFYSRSRRTLCRRGLVAMRLLPDAGSLLCIEVVWSAQRDDEASRALLCALPGWPFGEHVDIRSVYARPL